MNTKVLLIALAITSVSCKKNAEITQTTHTTPTAQEKNNDKSEFSQQDKEAKVKDIIKKGDSYVIDLNNVEVKYDSPKGDGDIEVTIINTDSKVKSFEISPTAKIQDENCNNISVAELYKQKDGIKALKRISYFAADGKITRINLGCWQ